MKKQHNLKQKQMEWIRINESTELVKEQKVFLADKISDSFAHYEAGERPFDGGPRDIVNDEGVKDTLDNFTHYCIPTLPKD